MFEVVEQRVAGVGVGSGCIQEERRVRWNCDGGAGVDRRHCIAGWCGRACGRTGGCGEVCDDLIEAGRVEVRIARTGCSGRVAGRLEIVETTDPGIGLDRAPRARFVGIGCRPCRAVTCVAVVGVVAAVLVAEFVSDEVDGVGVTGGRSRTGHAAALLTGHTDHTESGESAATRVSVVAHVVVGVADGHINHDLVDVEVSTQIVEGVTVRIAVPGPQAGGAARSKIGLVVEGRAVEREVVGVHDGDRPLAVEETVACTRDLDDVARRSTMTGCLHGDRAESRVGDRLDPDGCTRASSAGAGERQQVVVCDELELHGDFLLVNRRHTVGDRRQTRLRERNAGVEARERRVDRECKAMGPQLGPDATFGR